MGTAWSIKSPRFQFIILGIIGYFLVTIGGYVAFMFWAAGLYVMSRLSHRESTRNLLLAGVVINLIVAVIITLGLGTTYPHNSFWTVLKRGIVEQLLLAAIVAVILFIVYARRDGRVGT